MAFLRLAGSSIADGHDQRCPGLTKNGDPARPGSRLLPFYYGRSYCQKKSFRQAHETFLKPTRRRIPPRASQGVRSMLAEKFFLMLEALIRAQVHSDGAPRVVSTSQFVPVKLANPPLR
jgi:hypothetical protein